MLTVDKALVSWASKIVSNGVAVNTDLPISLDGSTAVCIYLLELSSAPPSHRNQSSPLQVSLKYLVFVSGKDVEKTHEALEGLLFAAMGDGSFGEGLVFEVDISPPSVAIWNSLGVPVRPSFCLHVMYSKARELKPVPRVSEAVEFNVFPTAVLSGTVTSSKGLPIVGAKVDLPASNASVKTDASGRFKFNAVPPTLKNSKLIVTYKGHTSSSTVSISQSPIDILVNLTEL